MEVPLRVRPWSTKGRGGRPNCRSLAFVRKSLTSRGIRGSYSLDFERFWAKAARLRGAGTPAEDFLRHDSSLESGEIPGIAHRECLIFANLSERLASRGAGAFCREISLSSSREIRARPGSFNRQDRKSTRLNSSH